ncbi:MAG: RNA-dependent RNA polymerase [Sanya cydistomyia duplonotatay narnavirus 1]|nr:MAG: RNA-dependent RNA polymerase [Sanya cydistomyia duplonotatay narnavirus 1]
MVSDTVSVGDVTAFCEKVWNSVRLTYVSVVPNGRVADLRVAMRFAAWLKRSTIHHGKTHVCTQLKGVAHAFRLWAITGRFPDISCLSLPRSFVLLLKGCASHAGARAQIARLGRALPPGDKLVAKAALRSYKDIIQTPPPASLDNDQICDEIYYWAKEFVSTRAATVSYNVSWAPNENAASLSFGRAEGGRTAELFSDAREILEPLLEFVPLTEGCPLLEEAVVETAIEKCKIEDFSADVMAVAQKGWKSRVLCKFSASHLLPGDIIRRQIWPLIEDEEWLDADRETNVTKLNSFLKYCRSRSGTCVSSDLSSATDYIPHRIAQALWFGLLEGLNVSPDHWSHKYVEKMFSPMDLRFPDGSTVTSQRGIHMGTPLSFSTLCLLHRFAVEKSGHRTFPHIVRGDDLIGLFDRPSEYFEAMKSIGFRINRDKTIVSPRGGVFVEQTLLFQRSIEQAHEFESNSLYAHISPHDLTKLARQVITDAKVCDDFPLSGLLNPSDDFAGSHLRRVGRWYADIASCATRSGRVVRKAAVVCRAFMAKAIKNARDLKVPLHIPLELGGAGIPDKHGRVGLDSAPYWLRALIGTAASDPKYAVKFAGAVRSVDGGVDSVFRRFYLRQHRDSSVERGRSVYTFEPESTEHYQAAKRRWIAFRILGGQSESSIRRRSRRERRAACPVPLAKWRKLFESIFKDRFGTLQSVPNRWVPKRNANCPRLASRIKFYNGCYIPTHLIRKPVFDLIDQAWAPDRGMSWGYSAHASAM